MMDRFLAPTVNLIAKTKISRTGMNFYLENIDAKDFKTEATSDGEELIEIAGKTCYMSFDTKLNKNLSRTNTKGNFDYIQDSILKTKHFSVIEHVSVTFGLVNVSRVFLHELVRHRHLSFSQVSGRYVRTDKIRVWLPKVIEDNVTLIDIFDDCFKFMENMMQRLEKISKINELTPKDFTYKKKLTSAFRRIIGEGQTNHIIVSGNLRSWREIIELRTNEHAEEEMRLVFNQIYAMLKYNFPAVFGNAVEKEVDGYLEITFP